MAIGLKVKNKVVLSSLDIDTLDASAGAVQLPVGTAIPTSAAMLAAGNGAFKIFQAAGTVGIAFVVAGTAYAIKGNAAAGSPVTTFILS